MVRGVPLQGIRVPSEEGLDSEGVCSVMMGVPLERVGVGGGDGLQTLIKLRQILPPSSPPPCPPCLIPPGSARPLLVPSNGGDVFDFISDPVSTTFSQRVQNCLILHFSGDGF